MYIPKHFRPEELVPPAVFSERGDLCLTLIDERVLRTLDRLRDSFGIITINDWLWGGNFTESGLRVPDSDCYSCYSQHTFGRAMDCKMKYIDAESARQSIIKSKALFPFISFLETDIDWLHFDVRNCQRIQLWSPKTKQSTFV
ncbi:MAG: hypothetical protein JAY71_18800 [Candidatus Thiodiazotropha weberae]|nr:hypothetical protein [Candidatus Thiodiazotropha weberae]